MRSNVEPEKTGDGVGLTGNAESNQRQRSNVANELRAYPLARGGVLSQSYSAVNWLSYFGARELTIFSKHGSPRSGSHHGCSFNSP